MGSGLGEGSKGQGMDMGGQGRGTAAGWLRRGLVVQLQVQAWLGLKDEGGCQGSGSLQEWMTGCQEVERLDLGWETGLLAMGWQGQWKEDP